jgi:hypothetical protein
MLVRSRYRCWRNALDGRATLEACRCEALTLVGTEDSDARGCDRCTWRRRLGGAGRQGVCDIALRLFASASGFSRTLADSDGYPDFDSAVLRRCWRSLPIFARRCHSQCRSIRASKRTSDLLNRLLNMRSVQFLIAQACDSLNTVAGSIRDARYAGKAAAIAAMAASVAAALTSVTGSRASIW